MGEGNTMSDQHRPFICLEDESGVESTYYSLVYEGFPEEFRLIAERELNETEEKRKRGMQKLKEYMKREHTTILDDSCLLAVIRNSKYNQKKAESKLKKFLQARKEIIRLISDMESDKIATILDDFGFGLLPYRDRHGRAVLYTRPDGMKLEGYEVFDIGVVLAASFLFLLKFPVSTVSGIVYFGECKSTNLYIFYPIFKTFRQLLSHVLSVPMRVAKVEVLNENYLVRWFFKCIKPLLSKKIVDRVSLLGYGYDSLHERYDPRILPEEFGGTMGPLNNTAYKQKLLDFIKDLKSEDY